MGHCKMGLHHVEMLLNAKTGENVHSSVSPLADREGIGLCYLYTQG